MNVTYYNGIACFATRTDSTCWLKQTLTIL